MQAAYNADELDEFVNVDSSCNYRCEQVEEFEQELAARDIRVTHSNDIADPVIVYMDGHRYVAWYDLENCMGYMPEY